MNINNIILPHVNIFSDKIVLSMGFCLGHVTEWGGGSISRVSDDKFAADANRNWQKNQQNCNGLLSQKKATFSFASLLIFFTGDPKAWMWKWFAAALMKIRREEALLGSNARLCHPDSLTEEADSVGYGGATCSFWEHGWCWHQYRRP